jgi:hypothetical protein
MLIVDRTRGRAATMDIVEKLEKDKPTFHWGGRRRWNAAPETLREIQRSVCRDMRTLETGCGASTVVFAAQGAIHTAISPTQDEHKRVANYLGQIGIDSSKLSFEAGFSDDVLPRVCNYSARMAEWDAWFSNHLGDEPKPSNTGVFGAGDLWKESDERCFEYIFLDGAHSFPYPVIDWHYSIRKLKIGGRLLLDDIPIPAVSCVYRYMRSDPSWKLLNIFDNRCATFELVADPAPENHTLQPYNRRPDFGFLPIHKRSYMVIAAEVRRLKGQLGERMSSLRQR